MGLKSTVLCKESISNVHAANLATYPFSFLIIRNVSYLGHVHRADGGFHGDSHSESPHNKLVAKHVGTDRWDPSAQLLSHYKLPLILYRFPQCHCGLRNYDNYPFSIACFGNAKEVSYAFMHWMVVAFVDWFLLKTVSICMRMINKVDEFARRILQPGTTVDC